MRTKKKEEKQKALSSASRSNNILVNVMELHYNTIEVNKNTIELIICTGGEE